MPKISGRVSLTPWQAFAAEWEGCTRCPLHRTRQKVVLAKGRVPCDILLCGEAPGRSEDALGAPFVGPAGKLLDGIIASSVPDGLRVAFANVLCCIPLNEAGEVKLSDLPAESVEACRPHLEDFILKVAKPRLIVCLGVVADEWFDAKAYRKADPFAGIARIKTIHPAGILRSVVAYRDLARQKCEVEIRDACAEVFGDGSS